MAVTKPDIRKCSVFQCFLPQVNAFLAKIHMLGSVAIVTTILLQSSPKDVAKLPCKTCLSLFFSRHMLMNTVYCIYNRFHNIRLIVALVTI